MRFLLRHRDADIGLMLTQSLLPLAIEHLDPYRAATAKHKKQSDDPALTGPEQHLVYSISVGKWSSALMRELNDVRLAYAIASLFPCVFAREPHKLRCVISKRATVARSSQPPKGPRGSPSHLHRGGSPHLQNGPPPALLRSRAPG